MVNINTANLYNQHGQHQHSRPLQSTWSTSTRPTSTINTVNINTINIDVVNIKTVNLNTVILNMAWGYLVLRKMPSWLELLGLLLASFGWTFKRTSTEIYSPFFSLVGRFLHKPERKAACWVLADCYRCYSQGGHVTVGQVPVWVDGWHVGHAWEGHGGYGGAHWAGGGWPRAWAGTVCPRSGVHLGVHLQRPPAQKRKKGRGLLSKVCHPARPPHKKVQGSWKKEEKTRQPFQGLLSTLSTYFQVFQLAKLLTRLTDEKGFRQL